MFKSSIYKKSPSVIQNVFLTGRGAVYNLLRQGRTFNKVYSELESTEYLDSPGIRELQNRRLRLLIPYAYENVPYYNRLFNRLGMAPSDIRTIEDLKRLPFLTKENIRRDPKDLLARDAKSLLLKKSFTSGTSGKPVRLYRDLYSISFENASWWRQRKWGGIGFSDRIAVLREEEIVPFEAKRPPFWRYSIFEKKLFLSAYHLCEENIGYYVKAIEEFKPQAIEAQPSSLYILSRFIKNLGIKLNLISLKAIFTSSEVLLPKHRELIGGVFNAPIYDFYGNAERVAAIGTCEEGSYHVLPEYSITEFLPLDETSGKTEIIGTSLHNYAMPLIRYRTGDMVELSEKDCRCKRRSHVIKKIHGRIADFLISQDGRFIYADACYMFLKGINNLIASQVIQEERNRIRIRFVPARNFSKETKQRLIGNVKTYMGSDIDVILEEDNSLLANREAKYRPFISHVSKSFSI